MDNYFTKLDNALKNEEDHKKKVGARIKELIKANNDTTIGIAKDVLGISRKTLEAYEKGENYPPVRVLFELSKRYECELDYLLCLQDDKTKEIGSASKTTGLSEEAIKALSNMREEPDKNIIDNLDNRFSRAFVNELILWDMLPKFIDYLVEEAVIRNKMKTIKLPSKHKSLLDSFMKYRHAYHGKEHGYWLAFEDALCDAFDIDKDTLRSEHVRPFDSEVYQFEEIIENLEADVFALESLLKDPNNRHDEHIPDDRFLMMLEHMEMHFPKRKNARKAMLEEKQKLLNCMEYWQYLFFVDTKDRRQFEIEQMQREFIEDQLKEWEE